jgi:hypothetical protein
LIPSFLHHKFLVSPSLSDWLGSTWFVKDFPLWKFSNKVKAIDGFVLHITLEGSNCSLSLLFMMKVIIWPHNFYLVWNKWDMLIRKQFSGFMFCIISDKNSSSDNKSRSWCWYFTSLVKTCTSPPF